MRRLSAFVLGAVLALASSSYGATGGGIPSRPKFQAVGIGNVPVAGTTGHLLIDSAAPTIVLNENDAGVDAGRWQLDSFGGQLRITSRTDASGSIFTPLLVPHDGTGGSIALTRFCTTACSLANLAIGSTAIINPASALGRPSTTTVAADGDFQFTSVPVGSYAMSFNMVFTGSAGGARINTLIAGGTGELTFTGVLNCVSIPSTTAVSIGTAGTGDVTCASVSTTHITGTGYARIATGASTISLTWAQNTSNATPTSRTVESWWTVTRLK